MMLAPVTFAHPCGKKITIDAYDIVMIDDLEGGGTEITFCVTIKLTRDFVTSESHDQVLAKLQEAKKISPDSPDGIGDPDDDADFWKS